MHFCQIFGLSKVLTGRGIGSQKVLTGRGNGSQKSITRSAFGHQIFLPEEDMVIKYSYRKEIWSSNILTGRRPGHQSDKDYSVDMKWFPAFISVWSMSGSGVLATPS